jgi:TRAP-type C4-dicarboxylate transport system substrate-binding protein
MQSAITDAVGFQRKLHVQEEEDARKAIEAQGCEIVELTAGEHYAFRAAVQPLLDDAQKTFGRDLFAPAAGRSG